MTDNDLRGAALSALYALENLQWDAANVWHYDSVVTRLKHALGRRLTPPEAIVDWADLVGMAEEGEAD